MTDKPALILRTASSDPESPVHLWFGLTYARYLTLPRVALQSMPHEWQVRFVRCLEELEAAFEDRPEQRAGVEYTVSCRDPWTHRFVADPWPNYDRGRAYIEPKPWKEVTMDELMQVVLDHEDRARLTAEPEGKE